MVASDSDGNVTIGGTLTYADVTNVDSVGVITARSGLNVTGGNVGIGTDNPTEDLEIVSDSITSAQLTSLGDDSATRTTRLNFNFSDGGGAAIAAKRAVGVANTEHIYLSELVELQTMMKKYVLSRMEMLASELIVHQHQYQSK